MTKEISSFNIYDKPKIHDIHTHTRTMLFILNALGTCYLGAQDSCPFPSLAFSIIKGWGVRSSLLSVIYESSNHLGHQRKRLAHPARIQPYYHNSSLHLILFQRYLFELFIYPIIGTTWWSSKFLMWGWNLVCIVCL